MSALSCSCYHSQVLSRGAVAQLRKSDTRRTLSKPAKGPNAFVLPRPVLARPGPAEVLTIRQLSGGKRTDLKRAALSRFVRTRLDIAPRGRISALVPINALPGPEIAPHLGGSAAPGTEQSGCSIGRNDSLLGRT